MRKLSFGLSCLRPALSGLVVISIAVGSPSCGSWSGNPPSSKVQTGTAPATPGDKQGTVEIVFQGSGASLKFLDKDLTVTDKAGKAAGSVTLNSVQIVVSDISLKRDRNDTSGRPLLAGPFVVDLLADSITPQPLPLTLPEGDYREISMNLYQKNGGSVQLIGTYVSAAQKTSSLKITLDAGDALSLMKDAQDKVIQVTPGSNQKVAISFQLSQWFNFSGKEADFATFSGPDITIDGSASGEAQKLREVFLNNVKAATDFEKISGKSGDGKDDDRDWDWYKNRNGDGSGRP